MKKLAAIFTIALTACGGDDGEQMMNQGPDAGDDQTDVTAPSVVSVTPADAAVGVRADAKVVIEFSEPMDQLSVQNSIDTSDLGGVTFAWSNGGATVTITPDGPLAYAEGTGNDPADTDALLYTVILGTGASDEAGNAIAAGVMTSFATLKSISTTLVRDNDLTAAGDPGEIVTDADDFLMIGDDDGQGAATAFRGYITIDLSPLSESVVEIVSATLQGEQVYESEFVYAALADGAGLLIDHVSFTLGDSNEINAAFNAVALSAVGKFADTGDTALSIDVSSQAQDDLENRADRNDRSQYRLRFTEFTNLDDTNDQVYIGRDNLEMDVVYLAP